jgi:hypothetical protein
MDDASASGRFPESDGHSQCPSFPAARPDPERLSRNGNMRQKNPIHLLIGDSYREEIRSTSPKRDKAILKEKRLC